MSVNRFTFTQSGSTNTTQMTTTVSELNLLTALAATGAEINARCDDSAMEQTLIAAGAVSTTVAYTNLSLVGAGAATLAAPTKPAMIKIIHMVTDNGDVTLELTNVVGGTAATTCTFNDVGDRLVLVSDTATSGKWIVLKEHGVTMS